MLERPEFKQQLIDFIQAHLPLARAMGLRADYYDGQRLDLSAPLELNINDKLTAFGGSLYNVAVMACWGMVYLQCRERGLDPNIVVGHAEVDYLLPVPDARIVASCQLKPGAFDEFFSRYDAGGRARVELHSQVNCDGRPALQFKGQYAIVP